jgi:hypothetical protein
MSTLWLMISVAVAKSTGNVVLKGQRHFRSIYLIDVIVAKRAKIPDRASQSALDTGAGRPDEHFINERALPTPLFLGTVNRHRHSPTRHLRGAAARQLDRANVSFETPRPR